MIMRLQATAAMGTTILGQPSNKSTDRAFVLFHAVAKRLKKRAARRAAL
jgi:hypothetical protein